ncbi:hypothetical protein BC834DRAFT_56769 [Gloeopeniophorella convolvens]|nr:hypothetical protein BC834DRAFT_56769 [Gloeopeniophorella convolvens]
MPISTTHPAQHRQAPFLGFLNACLQTKHLDPVEKLFDEHFRRRSQTLARYLSLTSWNLEKHPRPPPHHAVCTNTHRFGLNMSAQKFCIAKSLISTLYAGCGTLACLRSIKLSPYAVIYAAMDLDIPLPDDFDFWFLWRHLEQLLEREREADLVADSGILPPVHPCQQCRQSSGGHR